VLFEECVVVHVVWVEFMHPAVKHKRGATKITVMHGVEAALLESYSSIGILTQIVTRS
jgi:hypothetical protein